MASDESQKPGTGGQQGYVFDPNEHLIQLKSQEGLKDYLPVQWRLVWFRNEHAHGIIETTLLHLDLDKEIEKEGFTWNKDTRRSEKVMKRAKGIAVFHVTVRDSKGGVGTGTGSESAVDFDDFIEKAETKALGRALATLGYGTQFTGDEFDEKHRIVDAPVDRGEQSQGQKHGNPSPVPGTSNPEDKDKEPLATDQQVVSIRKLCQHLGEAEPDRLKEMTYQDAKALIIRLSNESNERAHKRKADPVTPTPAPTPTPVTGTASTESAEDPGENLLPEKAVIVIKRLETELGRFERKRFLKFLALPEDQDLYAPHLWQGAEGEALIKRAGEMLEKWLKPHVERTKFLTQTILPEQVRAILNPLPEGDYSAKNLRPVTQFREAYEANKESIQSFLILLLLGETKGMNQAEVDEAYKKAHMESVKIISSVIALDKDMHGKRIGAFTAEEADRFISYFEPQNGGFDVEEGIFTPNIPEAFRYKAKAA